jgi:hypothetical protein
MLVIVPVASTIRTRQRHNHYWLQDLFLLNDGDRFGGGARYIQKSLDGANPSIGLSVGCLTDVPSIDIVRHLEATGDSQLCRVFNGRDPEGADNHSVFVSLGEVNHVAL